MSMTGEGASAVAPGMLAFAVCGVEDAEDEDTT
jgi:hypothetical protein